MPQTLLHVRFFAFDNNFTDLVFSPCSRVADVPKILSYVPYISQILYAQVSLSPRAALTSALVLSPNLPTLFPYVPTILTHLTPILTYVPSILPHFSQIFAHM